MHAKRTITQSLGLGPQANDPEIDIYDPDGEYKPYGKSWQAWGGEPIVDLITCDGNQQGFVYSHLYRVGFDPAKGITLEFTNHLVTIQGNRMNQLYRFLTMQRVVYVAEADEATAKLLEELQKPFVNSILVQDRNE